MRYATIVDGEVDLVVMDPDDAWLAAYPGALPCEDWVGAGDFYDGVNFSRPLPPELNVTLGQLFDVATQLGVVSLAEVETLIGLKKGDVYLDKDGTLVTNTDAYDAVVEKAILENVEKPKDVPPWEDHVATDVVIEGEIRVEEPK